MKNRFDKGERKKGDRNDKQSSGNKSEQKSCAELKVKLTLYLFSMLIKKYGFFVFVIICPEK